MDSGRLGVDAPGIAMLPPFDEMHGPARRVRPRYARLAEWLTSTPAERMAAKREEEQGWFRLAIGRDYLDACPVRGLRRGSGDEAMSVRVYVGASVDQ